MIIETIETPRLLLCATTKEDVPFSLDLWTDPETCYYLADPPRDRADEQYLSWGKDVETEEGWYPMIVILRETGERIGTCSLVPYPDENRWDLGYALHRQYQRQGYGTEMIRAMIEYGRAHGGRVFTADVAKENAGSNAVLRKLGFAPVREGSFTKRNTEIVFESFTYQLEF